MITEDPIYLKVAALRRDDVPPIEIMRQLNLSRMQYKNAYQHAARNGALSTSFGALRVEDRNTPPSIFRENDAQAATWKRLLSDARR